MIDLLNKLVKFESDHNHQGKINQCFNFLVDDLKKSGLKVKTYSSSNRPSLVAAKNLKNHYRFILNGHIDIVPADYKNAYSPLEKRGRLYGRGTSDMKGPLAAMLDLAQNPELNKLDFALMITADEEIGGFDGVKYLLENKNYSCDCAIIPDGGDNLELVLAEKGVLHVRLVATGKAAHGSRPWMGDNAISKLVRIFLRISDSFPALTAPDYWHPTVNLGILKGGDATNKVPNQALMQLDFRFPDAEDEEKILNQLKKELTQESGVKLEVLSTGFPLINDPHNLYFKKIQQAAKKEKLNLKIKKEHGASDGRFFSEKRIPVIMFKPKCSAPHVDNEWVDLKSLMVFQKILKRFLLEN